MHRISTSGIARSKGRYFVALRKPGTSIGERWEFPGGKVKPGETPEQGLKREFQEEFNVPIRVGTRICEGEFTNKGTRYTLYAYAVEMEGVPEPVEHQECRWVSPEEIRFLDFPESDKIVLKALHLHSEGKR